MTQHPRVAAVLMVEDAGHAGSDTTERLGLALYGRFLAEAGYQRVLTLRGRERGDERLADAIRALAREHDAVDVVCSIHSMTRDPDALERAIPPEARKLRLVYSTACHGEAEERRAWERVGARTIVTHLGVNNPVIALPLILSRWLDGAELGAAVAEGFGETARVMDVVQALVALAPGGAQALPPIEGSRPVITGDARLTLGAPPGAPAALRYDRARGGPLGLALRALDGARLEHPELAGLLQRSRVPVSLPPGALERVASLAAERTGEDDGLLALTLADALEVPLGPATLELAGRVAAWAGPVDLEDGAFVVHVDGISVTLGPARARLTQVTVTTRDGVRLRVDGLLWGVLPVHRTFRLGAPASIET